MTATEVLNRLDKLGVTAWPNSGNIRFQPASRVPPGLKAQIKEHKPEILILLLDQAKRGDGHPPPLDRPPEGETELRRLRKGHSWLLDQHQRWQSGDTTAVDDAEFSRVWNGWWELDHQLRADYGFQGCIYGPIGVCPEGFPCQWCADLPTPGVVARLELTGIVGT